MSGKVELVSLFLVLTINALLNLLFVRVVGYLSGTELRSSGGTVGILANNNIKDWQHRFKLTQKEISIILNVDLRSVQRWGLKGLPASDNSTHSDILSRIDHFDSLAEAYVIWRNEGKAGNWNDVLCKICRVRKFSVMVKKLPVCEKCKKEWLT